jgi:hypothetical protein
VKHLLHEVPLLVGLGASAAPWQAIRAQGTLQFVDALAGVAEGHRIYRVRVR